MWHILNTYEKYFDLSTCLLYCKKVNTDGVEHAANLRLNKEY